MTSQLIFTMLNLALWIMLGYRFFRALKRRKVTDGASLYIWSVFFLLYLIVALKVPTIEAGIDERFSQLPVTMLIRSLLILGTAQVYSLLINQTDYALPKHIQRAFNLINPLIMLVCIGLFLFMVPSRLLSFDASEHVIKSIRDAAMIIWAVLIFIPAGVYLWRSERVRSAKLFQGLNLIFYAVYILNCAGELLWALVYAFAPQWETALTARLQYIDYLCILLFLFMLFPFHRLMPLFYPGRLWLLLRLRRLETAVTQMSDTTPQTFRLRHNLMHPDELELAIYQSAISILDSYTGIGERGQRIRERIEKLVESRPEYSDLIRGMAAIRL